MKLHAPYYTDKTTITVGKEIVEVKAFQIIVWVSLSLRSIFDWADKIPKFPAGNGEYLSVHHPDEKGLSTAYEFVARTLRHPSLYAANLHNRLCNLSPARA
jgi:hypothetical protein